MCIRDSLDTLGKIVLENKGILNTEQFLNLKYEKGTVQDYFNSMIAKIGENLVLNDLLVKENRNFNYAFYIHNSYRSNIGKIISFLDKEELDKLQKEEYKITKISSLNLQDNPEIKAYKDIQKIESFLAEVGSKLRKQLWPEGKEASSWWEDYAENKEKNGDKDS